jgi:hypothetical protein
LPWNEPHRSLLAVFRRCAIPISVVLLLQHRQSVHRAGNLQREVIRQPGDQAREEPEGDVLRVRPPNTGVLNAPEIPVDELIDPSLVRRGPDGDGWCGGLSVDPDLNRAGLLELVRDGRVGADARSA